LQDILGLSGGRRAGTVAGSIIAYWEREIKKGDM
jgi:hypothetical protein